MVKGDNIIAQLEDETSAYVTALSKTTICVSISQKGLATPAVKESITLSKNETVKIYLDENSEVCVQNASFPLVEQKDYTGHIVNPSFEGNSGKGWEGAPVVDYDCAEQYNTTLNMSSSQPASIAIRLSARM